MLISSLGSLDRLPEITKRYGPSKVLLVTGKVSFETSGAASVLVRHLSEKSFIRFSDFSINPKIEEAMLGVEMARQGNIDMILAIGGGSVLDMAKLIKAFFVKPDKACEIAEGKQPVQDPGIPLIAVPTTAGSGSEATHFAVVYKGTHKYSLASPIILPDAAILDGGLIKSNSPFQKAVNGLDALAQGIESTWAVGATEQSRELALKAVQEAVQFLPKILQGDSDVDHQSMIQAANLAGQAINTSKTTAAHAFSYAFTSHLQIPHGQAVWLTLPAIFQRHACSKDPALQPIMGRLMALLSIEDKTKSAERLRHFTESLGIVCDMKVLGADKVHQRAFIAGQVNQERLGNNPIAFSAQDIAEIFELA